MNNMNTKIVLVTGGAGQLGSEFRYLSGNKINNNEVSQNTDNLYLIFVTREELDIQSSEQVAIFCQENKIDVIVNCAAYTAVDKAESEQVQADAINHLAVKNLAQVAKDQSIKLIHISTDYVFDGTAHEPYKETDATNPQSVYGKTKLEGELAMKKINPANSIIIRTSWVYSEFGNNFVKTMLRLGRQRDELNVVCDQIGSPTNARDLALAILTIIPQLNNRLVDIYHYSNSGECSWSEFAKEIFSINKIESKVNPILTSEYPTIAKRPQYSVIDKSKITNAFGIKPLCWSDSLAQCIF
jgi:dTDP-4-dehydrorhamnose reductase